MECPAEIIASRRFGAATKAVASVIYSVARITDDVPRCTYPKGDVALVLGLSESSVERASAQLAKAGFWRRVEVRPNVWHWEILIKPAVGAQWADRFTAAKLARPPKTARGPSRTEEGGTPDLREGGTQGLGHQEQVSSNRIFEQKTSYDERSGEPWESGPPEDLVAHWDAPDASSNVVALDAPRPKRLAKALPEPPMQRSRKAQETTPKKRAPWTAGEHEPALRRVLDALHGARKHHGMRVPAAPFPIDRQNAGAILRRLKALIAEGHQDPVGLLCAVMRAKTLSHASASDSLVKGGAYATGDGFCNPARWSNTLVLAETYQALHGDSLPPTAPSAAPPIEPAPSVSAPRVLSTRDMRDTPEDWERFEAAKREAIAAEARGDLAHANRLYRLAADLKVKPSDERRMMAEAKRVAGLMARAAA